MDNQSFNNYIGNAIKEYRKKNNITQRELGEKIGLTHSTVSAYERGLVDFNLKTLFQISDIFNIQIDDLLPRNTKTYNKNFSFKKLKPEEIEILKTIFSEADSMNDDERELYIKNLKFATVYHNTLTNR